MNVSRGPRRKWKVTLNGVKLCHLRARSLKICLFSSSPPRSTTPDVDIDSKFASQLVTVNQSMDQKLESMSTTLMSRFALMLEEFRSGLNQTSFTEDPAVPGPSVSQKEPPSLQHPVSIKRQEGLRFRGSVEDPVPHGSGLAHQNVVDLVRHRVGVTEVSVWSGVSI